jgi:hypothetical protein
MIERSQHVNAPREGRPFLAVFGLAINEPAVFYQRQVWLIMSSLRIRGPENCRLGSTNQPSQNKS